MKLRLLSLFAVLLFTAGVLIQLLFSSGVVWAELEASIYGTQVAAGSLNLNCPLMLSSSESGMVTAAITNILDRSVPPVVIAEISKVGGMQTLSQTLTLAPHETRIVRWSINNSNVIFGRLILVNVIQARYSDLDPHRGFCGILNLNLFNLTGNESLILIFISGILFIVVGGILWARVHAPLDELADQTLKACGGLAGVTTLAALTALPRWWGLTLFLDVFALIMLSVIFTEFLLFPKATRS
ncbi:MAG TPA: hypothetical protein VIN60_06415 [Anaerolineales bacterium]